MGDVRVRHRKSGDAERGRQTRDVGEHSTCLGLLRKARKDGHRGIEGTALALTDDERGDLSLIESSNHLFDHIVNQSSRRLWCHYSGL